jgi:predicted DNA-binding protein YlxM (UPF0122 family)
MSFPLIPVSIGELLDKITILQIKSEYTNNEFVIKELDNLVNIAKEFNVFKSDYINNLKKINMSLWEIEDKIRIKEKNKEFDEEFINLARNVYITNDERARIKKEINEKENSIFKEIKLY